MQKLKLSMDDIVAVTNESRNVVYKAIAAGDLKTFLVGRRRFAMPADVEAWVAHLKKQSDAGHPVRYMGRDQEPRT